jgi:hypothetical protein
MQIKDLLINRRNYNEDKADAYIDNIKEQTVYELLTLKKELSESEELYPDISIMRSIRRDYDTDEED